MKLKELAARLECRLEGDGGIEILRVAGIEAAGPGDLTFFANPRYARALQGTRASAVIVGDGPIDAPCAILRSPHPYLSFAHALSLLAPAARPAAGIDPGARVSQDAVLGADVSIGAFVWIAPGAEVGARSVVYPLAAIGPGAVVGSDCVIHSRVSIRERVRIGDRVIVQDGAVVGSDGFGFAQRPDGTHQKIPQVGAVVIEDDVEIGANTTIDRPSVGETRVKAGAKIDNLVQIAHGVTVGRDALLAAQVGIAGSTEIEDRVTLAGQVGVAGHLRIGAGSVATAQSGIPNSLPPGAFVSGYPAMPNREWLRTSALIRKLPELRKALAELQERVAELEAEIKAMRSASGR